jgi:hypothetical protein
VETPIQIVVLQVVYLELWWALIISPINKLRYYIIAIPAKEELDLNIFILEIVLILLTVF